MKRFAFFVLIVGLAFVGCDTENGNNSGNGDEFVSSTNDTISNDIATLGLVGTSVSSSNSNVAIAEITTSAKIKITSVSEGAAVLTVSDVSNHNTTINISVSKTGLITVGTIVIWTPETSTNKIIGIWENIEDEEHFIRLTFTENGNVNYYQPIDHSGTISIMEMDGEFTIDFENFKISLKFPTFSEEWIIIDYELSSDGNTLTLIGLNGPSPIEFTRKITP